MGNFFGYAVWTGIITNQSSADRAYGSLTIWVAFFVFRPFIWALNGLASIILKPFGINAAAGHESLHSNEELQYLLDQGKESGALEDNEHELIKNVFDLLEMRASKKKITLTFDSNYSKPIYVRADQEKIQQVITNLVMNSIKYGKEGGTTEVSIEDLVNKILDEKRHNPKYNSSLLENQIDQLVYELYGLTEEEIRIVEGGEG